MKIKENIFPNSDVDKVTGWNKPQLYSCPEIVMAVNEQRTHLKSKVNFRKSNDEGH